MMELNGMKVIFTKLVTVERQRITVTIWEIIASGDLTAVVHNRTTGNQTYARIADGVYAFLGDDVQHDAPETHIAKSLLCREVFLCR